jgi:hypothetical protein
MPAVLPKKPLSDKFKKLETLGFIELATSLDVSEIKVELDANPDLWNKYGFRKTAPNTPHTQMTDIWIRSNKLENVGPHFCDEHYPIWYEAGKRLPATKKFIMDLMAWVGGENLGGVLITRIPPGFKIDKHIDDTWHAKFFDKFYLQIQGHPDQAFVSDDHDYRPNTGDVYWFNNTREHWVENNSNIDRITLIVCIKIDHD